MTFICGEEHAVPQLVEALRYQPEGRGSIPNGVTRILAVG
jgi:hypothetical protein